MRLTMRNVYIGVISLVVAAAGYFLINIVNSRNPIIVETPSHIDRPDINAFRSGQIGKIGDVNIAEMENPVYKHLNEKGELDREFTFKRVLRAAGTKWRVEKPGISFFRDDLSVIVTADEADVETETVLKQIRPKDAALEGNVVLHIIPKRPSDIKESFVYLENISFESDSSRAFTSGPVRFVSDDIQLAGKGMEFVYNGEKRRLEFLKIDTLDSLNLKVPAKSIPFSSQKDSAADKPAASLKQNANSSSGGKPVVPAANSAADRQTLYRWVFNKNVVIDTPQQVIFTDQFVINNILLKQSAPKSDAAPQNSQTAIETAAETKTDIPDNTAGSVKNTGKPEELMDITVTCKGGILFTPVDSDRQPELVDSKDTITGGRGLAKYGDTKNKAVIEGRKISFDAAANIAVLQENCTARMLANTQTVERRYSLTAPRIEVSFGGKNEQQIVSGIGHIRADGSMVQLAVEKLEQKKMLGFTKIKCNTIDYDPAAQTLLAGGPGLIAVDNSKMTQKETAAQKTDKKTDKLSLQKPCYAVIQDFASLEYNLKTDRILAQAGRNRINIGYMPIINGREGQVIKATVGRVEAEFVETKTGRTELVKLLASKGVTYDEQSNPDKRSKNKNIQLVGSDLVYNIEDAANPVINVWGNQSWPCFLNGVQVDGIEYQLSTGRIKEAKILGPGILW
jgi:hypothetical protein